MFEKIITLLSNGNLKKEVFKSNKAAPPENKKTSISDIPSVHQNSISDYLSNGELNAYALVNREHRTFFKPHLLKRLLIIDCLISAVIEGRQTNVQDMLSRNSRNMQEILNKRLIIDPVGRKFSCSALQYATWATDVNMIMMMLEFARKQNDANLTQLLKQQFNEVRTDGVVYELNGKTYRETQYDYAIINKLYSYLCAALTNYDFPIDSDPTTWNVNNVEFKANGDIAMCQVILSLLHAQQQMPHCVIQEICEPKPNNAHTVAELKSRKLSRTSNFIIMNEPLPYLQKLHQLNMFSPHYVINAAAHSISNVINQKTDTAPSFWLTGKKMGYRASSDEIRIYTNKKVYDWHSFLKEFSSAGAIVPTPGLLLKKEDRFACLLPVGSFHLDSKAVETHMRFLCNLRWARKTQLQELNEQLQELVEQPSLSLT